MFRTNGLFTYPFSYRFVNSCAFAYRRHREYTFLTDYLCFRTRLSRVACFCTAGIFTYTLSNSFCDLKLCFRTNGLLIYTLSYTFVNICALSYRRHRGYTFEYIIYLFMNRSVTRCIYLYSWSLDL